MRKQEKLFYQQKFKCNLGKWKTIKEQTDTEEKGLLQVNVGTETITSPKELAEQYSNHLLKKINTIKNQLNGSTVAAEKVYKSLVEENKASFTLKEVTIA